MSAPSDTGDSGRALGWVGHLDTALVCFDETFRFVYANAAAEQLLQIPREQLLGRTQWEVFPPTVGTELEHAYRHALAIREPVTFEQYHPDHDAWYRMDVRPVADGLDVTFADITAGRRPHPGTQPTTAQEAPALLDLLTEISVALSAHLDMEEAVRRLARLVIPRLADWCIVSTVDAATGQLQDLAVAHGDPARQPAAEHYARNRVPALATDSPAHRALASRRLVTAGKGRLDAVDELVAGLVTTPGARQQMS
ncbi:PAS domain S-box-containing protein [Modestobacter sp. DSM 44400]|uniref:PAS domain-containing protein n=1 Tax=Modestobacter sp. DSM 44400 TaxID=1550230 RepID=UPI0008977B8C|nr:PAS domain-containing protein [Modestobacter sp. DSM 44400]SDY98049.1 PAS domain S-box-containing protein [Modestobacter sp. DSM 44400]